MFFLFFLNFFSVYISANLKHALTVLVPKVFYECLLFVFIQHLLYITHIVERAKVNGSREFLENNI